MSVFDWLTGRSSQDQASTGSSSMAEESSTQGHQSADKTETNTQQQNTTSNTAANQTSTQSQTQTGNQSATGQQTVNGQQTQNLSSLDADTMAALKGLIGDKISDPNAFFSPQTTSATQASQLLSQFITDRAKSGGDEITQAAKAASAGAVQEFERGTMADVLAQAQRTGSTDNSFVQLLLNRGREGLSTNLAQIQANAILQGRQQQTQELTAAQAATAQAAQDSRALDQGKSQQTLDIARLVEQLKGGSVTGTTANTTTSNTKTDTISNAQTLGEIVNALSQTTESQTDLSSLVKSLSNSYADQTASRTAAGNNTQNITGERQGSLFDILRVNL